METVVVTYRIPLYLFVAAVACGSAACGDEKSPTAPTPAAPTLTAPAIESPATDQQLDTLRPTLIVRNATSDQSGSRTY